MEGTKAKLDATKHKIARLLDDAEDEPNADQRKELRRRANERRADVAHLTERLEAEQQQLEQSEHGQKAFANWKATFPTLIDKLHERKAGKYVNIELRHRMTAHLAEFIERIEVFSRGHSRGYDPETGEGDRFYDEMDGLVGDHIPNFPSDEDYKFIRYVIKRRMTMEGRFVRVYWKSGRHTDFGSKREHRQRHWLDPWSLWICQR